VTAVTFTVPGLPQPAGSKRAFAHRTTGRIVVTDANKNARSWKTDVAGVAAAAMRGAPLLEGPLELAVIFHVPRPKGHYGTGRNAGAVRAAAPTHPTVKPDVTKLLRAVEDAMTGIVWRDDAQVVVQRAEKRYGEPARAVIAVAPILPPLLAAAT
jgi:Holliday junction resolvase RusA-like endonuclease